MLSKAEKQGVFLQELRDYVHQSEVPNTYEVCNKVDCVGVWERKNYYLVLICRKILRTCFFYALGLVGRD